MKVYRLSSSLERISAVVISFILILSMFFLVYLLRTDILSFVICVLASLLVSAGLCFYVMNLFKAACLLYKEDMILEIKGYPDSFVHFTDAACLETVAVKNGPVTTRNIVFTDINGQVTASVPTFFTSNQGAQAEPLAMELAKELGIAFKASLEPWEYDKEKRKEHEKETALQQKQERKKNLRLMKEKILRKTGAGEPTPIPSEEVSVSDGILEEESDGINYDAMDDEK